jgi:hypothetical protein
MPPMMHLASGLPYASRQMSALSATWALRSLGQHRCAHQVLRAGLAVSWLAKDDITVRLFITVMWRRGCGKRCC